MPSPERVQKALDQIRKRGVNHDYFFAKLSTPDWIEPLDEAGLFLSPPAAIREGNSIRFPFWPEGRYLARMAALAPDLVLRVMEKVPDTDNVRVHEDYCEAAAVMPGRLAARWARRETAWIEFQPRLYFLLPERLGSLIVHLVATGEHDAALQLARAVLRIRKTPDRGLPLALFDGWHLDQFLQKHILPLLAVQPRKTLSLLCDCLADALVAEDAKADPPEDYSWIWRPAIEDHEQNGDNYDVRNALIRTIRDGAVRSASQQAVLIPELLADFDRRGWFVFQRLGIHLLVECSDHARSEARASVLSKRVFDTTQLHHEYGRLLQVVFMSLDSRDQEQVLEWIDSPSVAPYDPPAARDQRVLRRLIVLDGKLRSEWQSKLDALKAQLGQPDHPEFHSYSTTWVGPTSPIEQQALVLMTPTQLAEYCRSWTPSREWCSPTREGLARALQADVPKRVQEYLRAIPAFVGTDATYARSVVQGLVDAFRAKTAIELSPVIPLLEWVVSQERSIPGRSAEHLDEDPHWGWARRAVAELVGVACDCDSVPRSLRERVWKILEKLSVDPDPTPLDDQRSTMDPATRSINTTRGEAMHSIVRFALWEHRIEGADRKQVCMAGDVRDLLNQHLDVAVEPSTAVRAVYGRWLPWLVMMDHEWASSNLARIFPEVAEQALLRSAAWNTYVTFCSPYDDAFKLLSEQYAAAISSLGLADRTTQRSSHEGNALGEHLMLLTARGRIVWDDTDGLLRAFFKEAPSSIVEHAIAFVGRVLRSDDPPPSPEVVQRFVQLWEQVRGQMQDSNSTSCSALKEFGWWFSSGRFEPAWAAMCLREVLHCVGKIDPAFLVYEELERIASTNPVLAISLLRELVKTDEHGWNLIGSKDHVRATLAAGLHNPEVAEAALQIIHELGAHGHLEFRDLLSEQPSRGDRT